MQVYNLKKKDNNNQPKKAIKNVGIGYATQKYNI